MWISAIQCGCPGLRHSVLPVMGNCQRTYISQGHNEAKYSLLPEEPPCANRVTPAIQRFHWQQLFPPRGGGSATAETQKALSIQPYPIPYQGYFVNRVQWLDTSCTAGTGSGTYCACPWCLHVLFLPAQVLTADFDSFVLGLLVMGCWAYWWQ